MMKSSINGNSREGTPTLGIIGTGNYAVALSKRLTVTGYDVIMGSRNPEKRRPNIAFLSDCHSGYKVTSIYECLEKCSIIFVAIHVEDFKTTLGKYDKQCKEKILVDITNRKYRNASQSNADILASVLPQAVVVKAFNSISAYTMEDLTTSAASYQVSVASNNLEARSAVGDIAKAMGFRVVDLGGLKSALHMEDFVLKVFSHWTIPAILTFGIFNMWLLYILYLYFIETTEYQWEQIFLKVLNKPLCMTAITVLALTYFPGHVASFLQIYNGTRHKRFPPFLDTWLRCRKQLGLVSLILATGHVIISVLMMSPTYYKSWFHPATVTFPANATLTSDLDILVGTAWMGWKGEAACLVGVTAFIIMGIIGLTSIPSIGESLNWAEWRCVHSKLGYFVLFLTVAHVCIMGAPGWVKGQPITFVKSITFLSALFPVIVLFLKLLFICPPLKGYVRKIRRGWERNNTCIDSLPVVVEAQNVDKVACSNGTCKMNGVNKGFESGDGGVNGNAKCCCSTKSDVFSVTVQSESSAL